VIRYRAFTAWQLTPACKPTARRVWGETMNSANSMARDPARVGPANVFPAHPGLHSQDTQCEHEVQFYFDERFLIRSLSEFVASALRHACSTIIVATKSHREALTQELERTNVDLVAAVEQGRYVVLDAAETLDEFIVNGIPDETLFREVLGDVVSCSSAAAVARGGDAKVAIFGEMVALLWQRGETEAALRLERLWNQLAETHPFRLRCAYPLASFDRELHTEIFSKICCEHHSVIPAEDYTVLDERDRMRTVARLQQTRQALRTESAQRRLAQAQTLEARTLNEQLLKEIEKREAIEEELRRFTRRLLSARDEHQRRIAAELHENTAQLLAALSLYFSVLHDERESLSPRLAGVVANSRSISESLLNEIRKVSHLLHPPTLDDMGLAYALREYVEQFTASSGINIDLQIPGDLGRFGRDLELAVFRIIEDALAQFNPGESGVSAGVRITRRTDALIVGIEKVESERNYACASGANQHGRSKIGITGIRERVRERGGTVQLVSSPSGMLITVTLPLESGN
jgi:signal transduction histidine kinase